MRIEKSRKRIEKKVKQGFQGYPEITIAYFGVTTDSANEVSVSFLAEEGDEPMVERFPCTADARSDEVIQSAIVKVIERSEALTVHENSEVQIKP
jgi:hypothetical protein